MAHCKLVVFVLIFAIAHLSLGYSTREFDIQLSSSQLVRRGCDESPENNGFQNLIVKNGDVYVGATNIILQFTADLNLTHRHFNGPGNDSDQCNGPIYCEGVGDICRNQSTCADNYNKILLPYRNWLLACGTLYEVCELLHLNDVSVEAGPIEDLQCRSDTLSQDNNLSSRSKSLMVAAAFHLNNNLTDRDLLYIGKPGTFIETYIAPNEQNYYFTLSDSYSVGTKASYHLVWTTEEYAYALWTNYTTGRTKLSRYCNRAMESVSRDDASEVSREGMLSYTEIPISCENMLNVEISLVVTAKFQHGNLYVLYQEGNISHLCSTNLASLNDRFNFVRQQCFSSPTSYRHAKYLLNNCTNYDFIYNSNLSTCSFPNEYSSFLISENIGVVGINPFWLSTTMSLPLEAIEAKSFAVSVSNGIDVAFLGTSEGSVIKVRLEKNNSDIVEIITSNVSSSILNSMVIENDNTLYTISNKQILKMNLSACYQHETCSECLDSFDPYCGWCVLESRCTEKSTCADSNSEDKWIGPNKNSTLCPFLSALEPSFISVDQAATTIELTFAATRIQNDLSYDCTLTTNNNIILAQSNLEGFQGNGVTGRCVFQAVSKDVIPPTSDSENITLNIVHNQRNVISKTVRVYSCSKIPFLNNYTMCRSCALSEFGCSWCADIGTCSDIPTCSSPISNDGQCPVVNGLETQPTLVSVGENASFFLEVSNLRNVVDVNTCQFFFCGKNITSPATTNPSSLLEECRISGNMLTCPKSTSELEIYIRKDHYIIDTPLRDTVAAKLFNCSAEEVSGSCASCIAFRRQCSECAWCPSLGGCRTQAACNDPIFIVEDCANPIINSFFPTSGPFQGGTRVTILGRNLGSSISEITLVMVGNIECTIIPEFYITSRQIVCVTSGAVSRSDSGPIYVSTNYSKFARSSQNFNFRDVNVSRFSPKIVLNQTKVVVEGRNLNVSNNATIFFSSDNENRVNCVNRTSKSMICQLPPVKIIANFSLVLQIDNYVRNFNRKVRIRPLPNIEIPENLSAFKRAGGKITISLSTLEGVLTVGLQVDQGPITDCLILSTSSVECQISPISQSARKRRQALNYEATLILNDVHRLPVGDVTYYEDPVLTKLTMLPCQTRSDSNRNNVGNETSSLAKTIQIPGENFDLTKPNYTDYKIFLQPVKSDQAIPCIVTFIERTSLFCRASSEILSVEFDSKITVNVSIGKLNLTKPNVEYCPENINTLIALCLAIPIVLILLMVILVLLIRQRQRVKRQLRERTLILRKLDDLENKTREQARNAYFELQVGYMNNLSDNITRRITFRPPELYFIQTLFNLAGDHPVLDKNELHQESVRYEAIREWINLLKNKDFLMIFIRTMEEQKKFTIQEKGNVASLLVVSLFDDMPYFTGIMLDLLAELIHKHVHKNPKLLLRRSESVVEKMVSHWLSITLYDECILGKAGEPIFLMTKAIHYLVSSAPCDMIAQKSVNSLNESTLLSTEVSYSSKLLLASVQEENGNLTKPVDVTVVDVDSISQAKQKIIDEVYKDKPFSESPKPDDLEFELFDHGGNKEEAIILSDIDSSSEKHLNHIKINTLKHFNVNDKARVILRPVGTPRSPSSPDFSTPLLNGYGTEDNTFHLINPREDDISIGNGDLENGLAEKRADALLEGMINRPFQEIYLTRMVRSKTTLQEYVDGVFKSILSPDPIPKPVRYFFQFLDREAIRHGINDPEVVHIWKTNSLLLRYWVNVLKNPEFLFDVNKTIIVDSCLSVITQAFMDACSTTATRKLGQDSPSNKLLYAKDADNYRNMVNGFFKQVANTTWIREEDIDQVLKKLSNQYSYKFNPRVACQQLYQYLFKYKEQVLNSIRHDANEDLARKVEKISLMMEGKHINSTTVV